MAILRTLMSLAVTAMLIKSGMAANYTVGAPNGGWDTSTNLQSWASSQTFSVGDNLIFVYTGNHDVLEVSKADHDSCQTSNPMQTYMGGNTVIPLASAGKRYFTCGTGGHCSQGMKIEIDTLAAASSPPPSSPATPPPPVSSPSPPPRAQTPPPVSSPSPPPPQAQTPPPVSSPSPPPPQAETPRPVSTPSPPPQTETPPPETAPTMTPPSNSPGSSPSPSADVPNSADPPAPPPPSSATRVNILAGFGAGICSAIAILMSL